MKARQLIPNIWILISMLFTIHAFAQKDIVGYEYAFNNGENLQYVGITPTQDFNLNTSIDVSFLTSDINVFNIRFLDSDGLWSSIIFKIFIRPPDSATVNTNIIAYEYAFNDNEGLQFVPITPSQDFNLITDIDVNSLTSDINVFHIRFLDDAGKWSSMVSHIFIRPPDSATVNTNIIAYEYAFNDNEGLQFVPITPSQDFNLITDIDVNSLTSDINVFYIRFLDDAGKWSSMVSHIFIRPPNPDILVNNTLVSYDYWFDGDESTKTTVAIDPIVADFIVAELDMTTIWAGEHTIHSQFKDVYGQYSVATTDTINKAVLPIANFEANSTSICVGESISFTSNSIDYDSHVWNFDDGDTSTDINTSHIFLTAGLFDVSLTVEDTASGLDSIATQTIEVFSYPINTVSSSTPLPACFGSTVILTADDGNSDYLWSNGATTQSIEVTANETFSVSLTRINSPGCTVTSNNIEVIFNAEIDNTITHQEAPVLLTANQVGATYQWIDCTNGNTPIDGEINQTFTPTENGEYAVEVTQNGCTVTSDCETINTLSATDYVIKQLVQMFPNPVKEILNIHTEVPILLQVFNINGIQVKELKFNSGKQSIDIESLSSGLYFGKVIILSGKWTNQNSIYKIVKQ
ncbi:MAG: PKD domain-containing protein [Flavobacteriaceae bacterium]|nr:PKD domain-containing protein [Flavobacteriaceae bacterium]